VESETNKSFNQYLEAANLETQTQNELGKLYLNTNPVNDHDFREALNWFNKAAEQGYSRAINNIGLMYANGWGVKKDNNEAIKWYRKAAESGLDIAQLNLGLQYLNPKGSAGNNLEALKWIRLAAEKDNPSAIYTLGQIYEDGISGVEMNFKEADYWYGKYNQMTYH
jgi:TPR repeat protein